jgi:hypothetical protein
MEKGARSQAGFLYSSISILYSFWVAAAPVSSLDDLLAQLQEL